MHVGVRLAAALVGNRKANLPVIKRALHARTLAGLAEPTLAANLAFAPG